MVHHWFEGIDLRGCSIDQVEQLWISLERDDKKETYFFSLTDPVKRSMWRQAVMLSLVGLRGGNSGINLFQDEMQRLVDTLIAKK